MKLQVGLAEGGAAARARESALAKLEQLIARGQAQPMVATPVAFSKATQQRGDGGGVTAGVVDHQQRRYARLPE